MSTDHHVVAGCRTVLSEDLADGRDFDGIRVESPFPSWDVAP